VGGTRRLACPIGPESSASRRRTSSFRTTSHRHRGYRDHRKRPARSWGIRALGGHQQHYAHDLNRDLVHPDGTTCLLDTTAAPGPQLLPSSGHGRDARTAQPFIGSRQWHLAADCT